MLCEGCEDIIGAKIEGLGAWEGALGLHGCVQVAGHVGALSCMLKVASFIVAAPIWVPDFCMTW